MEAKFTERSKDSSKSFKLPPVVMTKGLHSLICTVKEMQPVTTYEEVLEGLGMYIASRKLYDSLNQKVCCKGDDLSSVLGTDEFAMSDLSALLLKLAVPVSKKQRDSAEGSTVLGDNPLKRKMDESIETTPKKMPSVNILTSMSPMFLRVPSSPSYCDKSDSVDSIQGYETAFVKDTSDDVSAVSGEETIFAVEETFEFECEDSDDSTFDDYSDSESGEITDIDEAILQFLQYYYYKPKPESDIEFFADASSDDDEQSDAEISESDFWSCPKCNIKNKPTVRYCLKCFQQRRNWLPDKPPNMKRRARRSRLGLRDTSVLSEASLLKCDRDSEGRNDSSRVSCDTRENSPEPSSGLWPEDSCDAELIDSPSLESVDSWGIASTPPSSMESVVSGSVESLSSHYMQSSGASSGSSCTLKESPEKLCMLCCSNPVNASIIHGRFAHQISCYECGRRLKRAKKDCPVCRRTIDRVVIQVTM